MLSLIGNAWNRSVGFLYRITTHFIDLGIFRLKAIAEWGLLTAAEFLSENGAGAAVFLGALAGAALVHALGWLQRRYNLQKLLKTPYVYVKMTFKYISSCILPLVYTF